MEANKKCGNFLQKEERKPLLRAEMNTLVAVRTPRGKAKTQLGLSLGADRMAVQGRKQPQGS